MSVSATVDVIVVVEEWRDILSVQLSRLVIRLQVFAKINLYLENKRVIFSPPCWTPSNTLDDKWRIWLWIVKTKLC